MTPPSCRAGRYRTASPPGARPARFARPALPCRLCRARRCRRVVRLRGTLWPPGQSVRITACGGGQRRAIPAPGRKDIPRPGPFALRGGRQCAHPAPGPSAPHAASRTFSATKENVRSDAHYVRRTGLRLGPVVADSVPVSDAPFAPPGCRAGRCRTAFPPGARHPRAGPKKHPAPRSFSSRGGGKGRPRSFDRGRPFVRVLLTQRRCTARRCRG